MRNATRAAGVATALAVFAIPIASFASDWRLGSGTFALAGYGLIALGGLISLLNLYLWFLRPWLLRRLHQTEEAQRHISGIPMLGMLVLPGLYLCPPSTLTSALVLLFVSLDTGNLAWFVWATWNDDSLWAQKPDG
ncbi:MAG: hypothetical protein AAF799_14700 [Myxococcota bacterium]